MSKISIRTYYRREPATDIPLYSNRGVLVRIVQMRTVIFISKRFSVRWPTKHFIKVKLNMYLSIQCFLFLQRFYILNINEEISRDSFWNKNVNNVCLWHDILQRLINILYSVSGLYSSFVAHVMIAFSAIAIYFLA